ncbi:MAG: hypothetical protein Q8O82_02935 [Pseudorhodobacter sp.]|nr:hypothetical protein [Pseudorhodobacter sp.]
MIPRINRLTLEVRQFMPKGTDLSDASQTWLNDVAALEVYGKEKGKGKSCASRLCLECGGNSLVAISEHWDLALIRRRGQG